MGVVLLAVVYVLAGKLGLSLAVVNASASPVWPPTGIAIAGLLLLGVSAWPAVLAGAFVVNFTTTWQFGSSAAIAAGNAGEAALGAWLAMRWAGGLAAFDSPGGLLRFAVAVALASAVSATVGVGALAAFGLAEGSALRELWHTWWLGDAAGGWLVAPAILVWARHPPRWRGLREAVEGGVVALATVATALAVFSPRPPHAPPSSFLVVPPLVWGALRLGPAFATVQMLAALAIMTACTATGRGAFSSAPPNQALLLLQGFGVVVGMTTLLLAVEGERRRAAEVALRESNADLEARVVERTEALRRTLEQLSAAEAAGMRESMQREFVASVSHELRTPISAILGFAETLRRGAIEDTRRRLPFVRTIERHARRLAALVDGLLQLAAVDSGRSKSQPVPVRLKTFVEEVLQGLAPLARQKALSVACDVPAGLDVLADRDQFLTIVQNLVENAIKYNRKGGSVRVEARPDGDEVRLRVVDTGLGIPEDELSYAFTRFHRGERVKHLRGTGLGLSIVKALAESNGGRVWVESREGEGSSFFVALPAVSLVAARTEREVDRDAR